MDDDTIRRARQADLVAFLVARGERLVPAGRDRDGAEQWRVDGQQVLVSRHIRS